jgi:CHASE3 domain sensor protein
MSIEKKKRALLAVHLLHPSACLFCWQRWSLRTITHAEAGARAVLVTHISSPGCNATASLLKDVETSQRGFLLTGRDDFPPHLSRSHGRASGKPQALGEFVAVTPDEAAVRRA